MNAATSLRSRGLAGIDRALDSTCRTARDTPRHEKQVGSPTASGSPSASSRRRLVTKLQRKPVASRNGDDAAAGARHPRRRLALADRAASTTKAADRHDSAFSSRRTGRGIATCSSWRRAAGVADSSGEDSPVIGAELVHAARKEMGGHARGCGAPPDAAGALGDPGEAALERAASIVGTELRWSESPPRRDRSGPQFLRTLNALKT